MNEVEKMMQAISAMLESAETRALLAEVVYTAPEAAKKNPHVPADEAVALAMNEWDVA